MAQHLSRLSRGFEEVHFKIEGADLYLECTFTLGLTSGPLVEIVVSNYLTLSPLRGVATLE